MRVDLVESAIDAVLTERLQSSILRMLVGMAGKAQRGYGSNANLSVLQRLSPTIWKDVRRKKPNAEFIQALAPAWDKVTGADIKTLDPHEAARPKNRKNLIFWVNHTPAKRIVPPARQREREREEDIPGNTLICITCYGDVLWENPKLYSFDALAPHFFERISVWADTAYMIDPAIFQNYRRPEPVSTYNPVGKPEQAPGRLSSDELSKARVASREGALVLMKPETVADNNRERYRKLLADRTTPEGIRDYTNRLVHLLHRRYVETFDALEQGGDVDFRIYERGQKLLRLQTDVWNLYKDIRHKAAQKHQFELEHPEHADKDYWTGFHSISSEWAKLKQIKKAAQGTDEEIYRY